MTRVVLVPGTLALLPEYAGLEDPVADLRAACLEAAAWLGRSITVLADEQGVRIAEYLLDRTDHMHEEESYLVVGNGSACRTEKAPGHLDERSHAFDEALGASLRGGRPEVDADLARQLWASVGAIAQLRDLGELGPAQVAYDDDPFGVQYWVMRWES
ncbi:hypothetical protein [Nocardioides sp. YIM 152315]|uniref:hypothetical protein n=1 Tax=Nocardioides sp. YIM 152315 TaxID=3031760 RepID=UPI0023DAA11D|nr:hypothetical protein [Nocardioides sp. YIM 152315]MDF1604970.1 hypothetical protein [Nocardioides sp. YIM 152315]